MLSLSKYPIRTPASTYVEAAYILHLMLRGGPGTDARSLVVDRRVGSAQVESPLDLNGAGHNALA